MIEMPTGVALLAIGAALFFLFVLTWGAVSGLSFWPRLLVRLVATAVLVILPLAFLALNEIGTDGGTSGAALPQATVDEQTRREYKYEAPKNGRPDVVQLDDDGAVAPQKRNGGDRAPAAAEPPPPAMIAEEPESPAAGGAPAPATPRGLTAAEPGAPLAPTPPAGADLKWDVVPVFYGTDRERQEKPRRAVAYGSERARRLEVGRALITVPKSHEVPLVERPWVITIPFTDIVVLEGAEDPNKHFTIENIVSLSKPEFLKLVQDRLALSARFKNHAVVFVHGYNTSFDNALYRTAQIAYDLHFDGAPFVYSWPSGGRIANYTYDRASADASKPYMREFLEMVCKETGATTVSVIAHSMGNGPLLDVLRDLKNAPPPGVAIAQLILAAPDVDRDEFGNLVRAFEGVARGVTLYAASNDRALRVSRGIWGAPRAGDVPAEGPLLVPGIDTIDVTAASTDVLSINHSGYATNKGLLEDIALLIEKGVRPPETRFPAMKPKSSASGSYWLYEPPPPSSP